MGQILPFPNHSCDLCKQERELQRLAKAEANSERIYGVKQRKYRVELFMFQLIRAMHEKGEVYGR